jgi:hypothetical protein
MKQGETEASMYQRELMLPFGVGVYIRKRRKSHWTEHPDERDWSKLGWCELMRRYVIRIRMRQIA